jgi:hypothetical protein
MVRQTTEADVTAMRLRLNAINANAVEADTLENRTDAALQVLQTSSQLANIITACATLGAWQIFPCAIRAIPT